MESVHIRKELKRKIVNVEPSNNIFEELGNNNYNFVELLSELIDNSLAARMNDKLLDVQIIIGHSESIPTDSYLIVRDNAKGISFNDLGSAISPAANSGGGGINEHGLGMKQAVASLGTLRHLATKHYLSDETLHINKFSYGELEAKVFDKEWDHGTELCVENIKSIVPIAQQKYTMSVLPYLGAKYRRYLKEDNPKLKMSISLIDIDNIGDNGEPTIIFNKLVSPVKPFYFHPSTRTNKPIYVNHKFNGIGWEANFTFGYAPTDEEYEELGISKPEKYMPYDVSINKQGFDLIEFDRVINFAQLSSVGIVSNIHNDYNYIRGEIDLIRGFETSTTKNFFIRNEHFMQLINEIRQFLKEKKLLERKNDPDELPESLLRNRLAEYLLTNPLYPKNIVRKEYSVGKLNGYIDVFADDSEAWEIKKGQCSGTDIYQLFAYMDMDDIKTGFLLANDFTTGAEEARQFINDKHKINITFVRLEQLPILHPATSDERKIHYRK